MHVLALLLHCATLLSVALCAAAASRQARRSPGAEPPVRRHTFFNCAETVVNPVPSAYCKAPPTCQVHLPTFGGVWFVLYTSGEMPFLGAGDCMTTKLMSNIEGTSVDNCVASKTAWRNGYAECRPGFAEPLRNGGGGGTTTGSFSASFVDVLGSVDDSTLVHVVAVVGDVQTGYHMAAVFQCSVDAAGHSSQGMAILSRDVHDAWMVLRILQLKLRCAGYDTSGDFREVRHRNCRYADGPPRFTTEDA